MKKLIFFVSLVVFSFSGLSKEESSLEEEKSWITCQGARMTEYPKEANIFTRLISSETNLVKCVEIKKDHHQVKHEWFFNSYDVEHLFKYPGFTIYCVTPYIKKGKHCSEESVMYFPADIVSMKDSEN